MHSRRYLWLACVVFGALRAYPLRIHIQAMLGDEPVVGAQVCIFRAPGLGAPDPIAKYFTSNDVRCIAGDQVLAFPEGNWAYYITTPDGYASFGSRGARIEGAAEAGYKKVLVEVYPAHAINFADVLPRLKAGEFPLVYLPDKPTENGAAIPVPSGASQVLIPNDVPWVPVISNGRTITRVGNVRSGENSPVSLPPTEFDANPDTYDVVGWYQYGEGERDYVINAPAPLVAAVTVGGTQVKPLIHTRRTYSDGLFIFKSLPLSARTLILSGDYWERHVTTLTPEANETVKVVSGLPANPAGVIRVEPSIDPSLFVARTERLSCAGAPDNEQVGSVMFAVERCPDLSLSMTPGELRQMHNCEDAQKHSVTRESLKKGIDFTALPPGMYRVSGVIGRLSSQYVGVAVTKGRLSEVSMDMSYAHIQGRVTRAGRPASVRLDFERAAATAFSDPVTGEYVATVAGDRSRGFVSIKSCDGNLSYKFFPDAASIASGVLNIDIPDNVLHVTVHSSGSFEPVTGASTVARIEEIIDGRPTVYNGALGRTSHDGKVDLAFLPIGHEIAICVRHEEFEENCRAVGQLKSDEARNVTIELTRAVKTTCRVVSPYPTTGALVVWPNSAGPPEIDFVSDDGSFKCSPPHPGEFASLVSVRHPLVAVQPTRNDDGTVLLTVPAAPVRTILVRSSPAAPRGDFDIAIRVNGLTIPDGAFSRYQGLRGFQTTLVSGGGLTIPDVLAVGSIEVIRGPSVDLYPQAANVGVSSACGSPEFRALCASATVPASNIVILP